MLRKICNRMALCCLIFAAAPAGYAQGWRHAGDVDRVEKLADGVELSAGRARVRVTAFRDGIFRVTALSRRFLRQPLAIS